MFKTPNSQLIKLNKLNKRKRKLTAYEDKYLPFLTTWGRILCTARKILLFVSKRIGFVFYSGNGNE